MKTLINLVIFFRVITGVSFVKVNHVIHIRIQEGTLLPGGHIDQDSVNWKNVDGYKLSDENVKPDLDYHTIHWNKRAIDLDDLKATSLHLITGLKFQLIGGHLKLLVKETHIDVSTGNLIVGKFSWRQSGKAQ